MRIGDLLEWLAGASGITAAYLGTGRLWAAFATAALVLVYQAQCYGSHPWPNLKRPGWLKRKPTD